MVAAASFLIDTLTPSNFADRIASELVHARRVARGIVVTTPVLFPSGAHVSILVTFTGDRCLVSDDGAAYAEADMMGAGDIFRRAARSIAEECGLRFNNFEIFETDARVDTLPGIIAIVADAAKRAIHVTADRLARKLDFDLKTSIVDRLIDAFGVKRVAVDASISGASTHSWTVDALVRTESVEVAIEAVSPSPISVSSAYMKLDDIRRLDHAPKTVAALKGKSSFGADQLLILGRTSRLIDVAADWRELERIAA
ncbi:hypothetical protein HJA77_13630 [Rhizobium bangladeshense]|uniref:hypothetical protein n=1 Tax=Rhizobium bangladeshense TaxID=1138189 RepID=UPI001C90D81D|nr:hypothetical protein [Rhizobium bangladeshense]MBY3582198.1 hypothetical protein [Rhizobium bangladeshense]MBY3597589.1 hypothetical protein [Rhizobium bangladeshense]